MDRFYDRLRKFRFKISLYRLKSKKPREMVFRFIYYSLISWVGISLSLIFFFQTKDMASNLFANLYDFSVNVGILIATMFTLVLSLSIIPIQRSVETYGPTVTKLLKENIFSNAIYMILGITCVISLFWAVKPFWNIHPSFGFSIQIMLVAISIDMIRWHYHTIIAQLDPIKAIESLEKRIKKQIWDNQNIVAYLAKLHQRSLPELERATFLPETLERQIYEQLPDLNQKIIQMVNELTSISNKGIINCDDLMAELAINSMGKIACSYIDARKKNLYVYPAPGAPLVVDTDLKIVLIPLYENLRTISRNAADKKAEAICLRTIRTLGNIAIHATQIHPIPMQENSAPLVWNPIGYMKMCIENAQINRLDEVPYQGSNELLRVALNAPHNIDIHNVYSPIIDGWKSIVLSFLTNGKGVLADKIIGNMMELALHVVKEKHFCSIDVIGDMLNILCEITPLLLMNEQRFGSPFTAYDLTKSYSLSYIVELAASHIKKEESKDRIDPFMDFNELNKAIWTHLRNVGANTDIGSSFLLWHIVQTIKHIAKVYLSILDSPQPNWQNYIDHLIENFSWYLSVFWASLDKAKVIRPELANDVCDTLAWIGLSFYSKGYTKTLLDSADDIVSVIESYCKVNPNSSPYDIADLQISLWVLKMGVEAQDDEILLEALEKKINTTPKTLQNNLLPAVIDAFENRKSHLTERLTDNFSIMRDDSVSLLRMLLGSNASSHENT